MEVQEMKEKVIKFRKRLIMLTKAEDEFLENKKTKTGIGVSETLRRIIDKHIEGESKEVRPPVPRPGEWMIVEKEQRKEKVR
jgi:hypothetical protein